MNNTQQNVISIRLSVIITLICTHARARTNIQSIKILSLELCLVVCRFKASRISSPPNATCLEQQNSQTSRMNHAGVIVTYLNEITGGDRSSELETPARLLPVSRVTPPKPFHYLYSLHATYVVLCIPAT